MKPTFLKQLFLILSCVALNGISLAWSQAWVEDWKDNSNPYFYYNTGGSSSTNKYEFPLSENTASDSSILILRIDTSDVSGAYQGPHMTSKELLGFGTYAARLKIPSAEQQPKVGAIVGLFNFYNDEWSQLQEADINNNGLHDNVEIDFEWLIADPEVIYITAYTDFHGPTGETRKVGRVINLAEGFIYSTEYAERLGGIGTPLTGVENSPTTIPAIPGYDASKDFYTYGYDWNTDRIRWWIIHPTTQDTVVLWDYQGPSSRIPQKLGSFIINFWHSDSWSVITQPGTTEKPRFPFELELDWMSFTPAEQTSSLRQESHSSGLQYTLLSRNLHEFRRASSKQSAPWSLINSQGKVLQQGTLDSGESTLRLDTSNDAQQALYLQFSQQRFTIRPN